MSLSVFRRARLGTQKGGAQGWASGRSCAATHTRCARRSPYKLAVVALFVASAFVLPLLPMMRLARQVAELSEDEESHVVVVHDESEPLGKWKRALRAIRAPKRKEE